MVEVSKDEAEVAAEAYAKATNYYGNFHRGLSSPSADNIRRGVRAALEAVSLTTLQAERDRYRVALEAFVTALEDWGDDTGQPDCWEVWEHPIAMGVTLGDFRRARTALSDTPTVQSDGWIEWTGGNCPVAPGIETAVRFRDGGEVTDSCPEGWNWGEDGGGTIIEYRVVSK